MIEDIAQVVFVVITSLIIAPIILFLSSLLYIGFRFRRGTIYFFVKILLIGLMVIPMAIIVIFCSLLLFGTVGISRMWRTWATYTGKVSMAVADTAIPLHPDDVVVHLMHGTFESNAAWTQPDSPLCQAILNRNPSVRLSRFIWSGLNTHRERREAADLFAEQVRASVSRHHYVVAHSHAGNILKDASERASDIGQKIMGVSLLSTPFIFRQAVERTGRAFVAAHSLGFAIVAQLLLAPALVPFDAYGPVTVVLSMLVVILLERKLSKKFQAQLNKELEIEKGDISFRNVQILHAIGDEADSLLRFVSFLHESCFSLFSQLQATARQMSGHGALHLVTLGVLAVAMAGAWLAGVTAWKFWVSAMFIVALGVLASYFKEKWRPSRNEEPTVLFMMSLPVGFISFWLAAAKSLAYGDIRLLFCPSMFVFSSETPEGDNHKPIKYAPGSDGILIHSTHSHKHAIRDVAEWLHEREKIRLKRKIYTTDDV